MGETLLKLVIAGFGGWFVVGHVSDALARGRAYLRGTEGFTVEQPWQFSAALGLNVAFGFLLFSTPFFADILLFAVPDWLMHLALKLGIAWFAVMLTVAVYVVTAVRIVVFMATRK
jgi:hypothetical protein